MVRDSATHVLAPCARPAAAQCSRARQRGGSVQPPRPSRRHPASLRAPHTRFTNLGGHTSTGTIGHVSCPTMSSRSLCMHDKKQLIFGLVQGAPPLACQACAPAPARRAECAQRARRARERARRTGGPAVRVQVEAGLGPAVARQREELHVRVPDRRAAVGALHGDAKQPLGQLRAGAAAWAPTSSRSLALLQA